MADAAIVVLLCPTHFPSGVPIVRRNGWKQISTFFFCGLVWFMVPCRSVSRDKGSYTPRTSPSPPGDSGVAATMLPISLSNDTR